MTDNSDNINELVRKLDILLKKQDDFSREIDFLKAEIDQLKAPGSVIGRPKEEPSPIAPENRAPQGEPVYRSPVSIPASSSRSRRFPRLKTDLEKFIGENLINKIGMGITVIGVGIGAKYAIDNQLISPLTRIILGYLLGTGLLAFAIALKKKYENFSAVLLSGSMATLYFITYSAYAFYGLLPQTAAFALMPALTGFTVAAAIHYNRQVIAQIGLVGAYAVPFLLGNDSGDAAVLFTYMAIINAGILAISLKKYWKSVYYTSFGLTWLIYVFWYLSQYNPREDFVLSLISVSVFFGLFYFTFLGRKLLQREQFDARDIFLLLANSFLYYGLGYAILNDHEIGKNLPGLFTLLNAIVHFIVSAVIFRQKLADRNLFFVVSGLVLVFIAIAIPVQLDGNWVTLLWCGQAVLLFWIGRTRNVPAYEKLSYPLMILAFFSLGEDWATGYNSYYPENPETKLKPLLNIHFLSSLIFASAFGFISFLQRKTHPPFAQKEWMARMIRFIIPAIFVFVLYYAFRLEIAAYFEQLYKDSTFPESPGNEPYTHRDYDLMRFKSVWLLLYSLLFVSVLAFVNIKKWKDRKLGLVNLSLLVLALLAFMSQGLYELSELRESYLNQELSQYYARTPFHIGIRYISFLFAVVAILAFYQHTRQDFMRIQNRFVFDLVLHISILWMMSSELINWLDIAKSGHSYKLGLSILWGVYSLFLIAFGIYRKKKHLRIGAIALFGITLAKLFFYDISHLDTIAKTIVLISLGILLLIISFLYNKYKHLISDE